MSFAARVIQTQNKRYQYCKHLCIISSVSVNSLSSKEDLHSSQGWQVPKYVQFSYVYLPEKAKFKAVVHAVNADCAMKKYTCRWVRVRSKAKDRSKASKHYPESQGRKPFPPVYNPLYLSKRSSPESYNQYAHFFKRRLL